MSSGYSTGTKETTLRNDGPTLEEFLAAGYTVEAYPPHGWAEQPSEGLTLYRTTGQVPVAQPVATDPPQDLPVAAAVVAAGDATDAPTDTALTDVLPDSAVDVSPEPPTRGKRK